MFGADPGSRSSFNRLANLARRWGGVGGTISTGTPGVSANAGGQIVYLDKAGRLTTSGALQFSGWRDSPGSQNQLMANSVHGVGGGMQAWDGSGNLKFSCGNNGVMINGSAAAGYWFRNGTNINASSTDLGLYRQAAGLLELNTGTALGSGGAAAAIAHKENVLAKTANYSVVIADTNSFFTNTGATGEVDFTLPTAAAGLKYKFYIDAAQTLKVIAGASTTIRIAGSQSAAAGNISASAAGNYIELVAISSTQWVATTTLGTWTVT